LKKGFFFTVIIVVLSALITGPVIASVVKIQKFRYSLDAASPTAVSEGFTQDDVLQSDPTRTPVIVTDTEGENLGLNPNVNLNALSYGNEDIFTKGKNDFRTGPLLYFSVDRASVGMPGTAVNAQKSGNSAAADIFGAFNTSLPDPHQLIYDNSLLGLTGDGIGDDIDALAVKPQGSRLYLLFNRFCICYRSFCRSC
jgi:hypothetical protein